MKIFAVQSSRLFRFDKLKVHSSRRREIQSSRLKVVGEIQSSKLEASRNQESSRLHSWRNEFKSSELGVGEI